MAVPALIFPLLLAAIPSAADLSTARCPKPAVAEEKATFKRLGELPPAEAFKAVWRLKQCGAPVVLARDRLTPVPRRPR